MLAYHTRLPATTIVAALQAHPVIMARMSINSATTSFDKQDRAVAAALGLLALVVYLLTSSLAFHSIDEIAVFTVSRNLAARGSFDGDILFWTRPALGIGSIVADGRDGHTYVVKDVAPAILITPFVWLVHRLSISPIRFALLFGPLITALTVSLIYYVIRAWNYPRAAALAGALTYGFASLSWPYAETLFTQSLAALGLLIALVGTVHAQQHQSGRAALIGGLGLGLAGMSAVPTWVSLPIHIFYLIPWGLVRQGWRPALRSTLPVISSFSVGAIFFFLFQSLYNFLRFGSPFETGYQQVGASGIRLMYLATGFFGQSLSTPRGIIWYAPFVLLAPFGLWIGWRTTQRRQIILCAAQAGLIFLLYSSYATWWAGLGWGPRFLAVVMPALTLLTIPLFDELFTGRIRWARIPVTVIWLISFLTQLGAALIDYLDTETEISRTLLKITPPPSFIVNEPLLTDFRLLPIPRLITTLQNGKLDVFWIKEGQTDWLVLVALILLTVIAIGLLVRLFRSDGMHHSPLISICAAMVSFFIIFVVARYSDGPYDAVGIAPVVNEINRNVQSGDGLLVLLPDNFLGWIQEYNSAIPDTGVVMEKPLSERSGKMLNVSSTRYDRLWLISEGTVGGNPENGIELWLSENAYAGSETWIGGIRVVPYGLEQNMPTKPINQVFGADQIELISGGVKARQPLNAQGWVDVVLNWKSLSRLDQDYTVFVQLLDANGSLVAQHDGQPAAGYMPTSTWQPQVTVSDRHSIIVPASTPQGDYRLIVGLYLPTTGERLHFAKSDQDSFLLETIHIGP